MDCNAHVIDHADNVFDLFWIDDTFWQVVVNLVVGQIPSQEGVLAEEITINGLAILDDSFDLKQYFLDAVVGGPGSFVMAVDSYADFATAIRLKLMREISGKPVAGLGATDGATVALREPSAINGFGNPLNGATVRGP